MEKVAYIKANNGDLFIMIRDYQDFSGWIILTIVNGDAYAKADKRLPGDRKRAEAKFAELYSYYGTVQHKTFKEIIKDL